MNRQLAQEAVEAAIGRFLEVDSYLLENDLNERCLTSRLAWHLQSLLPNYHVDVEYNRAGASPKRLALPEECANSVNEWGESLVVPDIIVHRRGPEGPNVLAIEVKKAGNPEGQDCDLLKIDAFKHQFGYLHGVLLECATGEDALIRITEWLGE